MQRATRTTVLAAALAAIAFTAKAQDGDIAAGHAFARETCRACQQVEAEEPSQRMIQIGPALRDIANTSGMTATALRVFLTSSHPKMPNLFLMPEEIADVSTYILSLRNHR
jgi:cytochrome c2